MEIALCYPSVIPAQGGCETYIAMLARRIAQDGHGIHLIASQWDEAALPAAVHYHRVAAPRGPRSLKPWRFAAECERMLKSVPHHISMGFDKTWGQDVLYPQGGLHVAAQAQNIVKYQPGAKRWVAKQVKQFDPANWSFRELEIQQYQRRPAPIIVANSEMVRGHFEKFYGIGPERVRVVHSAIDPTKYFADDRLVVRARQREQWGIGPETSVGLLVAMNYRLKGLDVLLSAVAKLPRERDFRLVVVGNSKTASYQNLANRLKIADRVHFAGFQADTRDSYFAADFLVHPTFYDPCSLVALEAIACSLPVVTSQYNGAKELLKPSNSVIVEDPHNATELAAAVGMYLDPSVRAMAATAARASALEWTFETHYRALLNILHESRGLRRAA